MTRTDDAREQPAVERPIATRAPAPKPRRLSRKALVTLATAGAFAIAGALAWSLSDRREQTGPEAVSVAPGQSVEVLSDAPKNYDDPALRAAANMGPPSNTPPEDPPEPSSPADANPPSGPDPAEAEAQRQRQQAEAARGAKLFAADGPTRRAPTASDAAAPTSSGPLDRDRMEKAPSDLPVHPARLNTSPGPHTILAGATIAAALITGLSSDVPGQVIAQVTEDVFDTVTGRIRLIPQGARLLGDYDARVAHGQTRAHILWTRLILPDGRSIDLGRMSATDGSGASGVAGKVDNHWGSIVRAGLLSSLFGVGNELADNGGDDAIADAIRDSSGETIGRAGDRIVERQLQIQPTITVRPGARIRLLVSRDLVLKPYPSN